MNKQEKNIKNVIVLENIEEIVDIFIEYLEEICKGTSPTTLITNKDLVGYALRETLKLDWVSVKKLDFELEGVEYMISVDKDGNLIVQPIDCYDEYFEEIKYAFVDMDGCVSQMTIDKLLDMDIPVVLFGYDDECDCDEFGCACQKDEKPVTASKSIYTINGKSVTKEQFDRKFDELEEKYLDNIRDMLLNHLEFQQEMDEWRRLFRW